MSNIENLYQAVDTFEREESALVKDPLMDVEYHDGRQKAFALVKRLMTEVWFSKELKGVHAS